MPNVSGYMNRVSETFNTNGYAGGIIHKVGSENARETPSKTDNSHAGNINIYLHRGSNQYQNISEVRVKSIISIGFIKLY